ncbi:MAG: J domain-containing protein, partial [Chloroflexi bacterium]|nr:J domain-containing protein [Chloroflexota bacterium]
MQYKDYYKSLGVNKGATEKEIKKAYRKLARQCHPDVCPGDQSAEERFKEINEAYEVLGDPEKRQKYDQFGADWQNWQQGGSQAGGFDWSRYAAGQGQPGGGGFRVNYQDLGDMGGFGAGGFSDFFETLFGGAAGRAARDDPWQQIRRRPHRGQDVEHEVEITLQEAYTGTKRILQMQGTDPCPSCGGTGLSSGQPCRACGGTGMTQRTKRIEVSIPPGADTGSKVRMAGQGGPGASGGDQGDLYLLVKVDPDPNFKRDGDNLYVDVPVDLYLALLGGEVHVPTLRGKSLALTIPPETQNGRTFRLGGQGMPQLKNPDKHGDLFATIQV